MFSKLRVLSSRLMVLSKGILTAESSNILGEPEVFKLSTIIVSVAKLPLLSVSKVAVILAPRSGDQEPAHLPVSSFNVTVSSSPSSSILSV